MDRIAFALAMLVGLGLLWLGCTFHQTAYGIMGGVTLGAFSVKLWHG